MDSETFRIISSFKTLDVTQYTIAQMERKRAKSLVFSMSVGGGQKLPSARLLPRAEAKCPKTDDAC